MSTKTASSEAVVCPLCGWAGPQFEPMGRTSRRARCGRCNSLERHRALFLYLRDETPIFSAPTRLLHFAPEPALSRLFEQHSNIEYVTTDLEMPGVSVHMDIADLLFRDDVFDCVICSHVLEHVPDDYAAMREIARVLRPDGIALILVPILKTPDGRTFEDPSIVTPEERERVYRQHDHLRSYGQDFPERARDSGLEVTVVRYPRDLGPDATRRFGLLPDEQLFVCRPAHRRAPQVADTTLPLTRAAFAAKAAHRTELDFIREISPADNMLRPDAPDHYYKVGLEALEIVKKALAAAGAARPRTILDLPSGYGRVLRMLKAAFGEAWITACDTDRNAVDFCARTFDVKTALADPNPAALSLPESYELIWCGSLLTHLPERAFHALLARFEAHLTPGGVLVFTTHGQTIERLLRAGRMHVAISDESAESLCGSYERTGFGFAPYTHSRDADYGIALSSAEWVRTAVARRAGLQLSSHWEAEWDQRQDAVVCQRSTGT